MDKDKLIDKMKDFFDNITAEDFIKKWNAIEFNGENELTIEQYLKKIKERNNL